MIVGFSRHGTGNGKSAIRYFLSDKDKNGKRRSILPVVVRGDPDVVGEIIRSSPNRWKYTSGVLSWAPGEVVSPEQELELINEFERVAFAGLEVDQYSILWVRHQHAGHHELHFLTPRIELRTRKSLNIRPPGEAALKLFDAFRTFVNAKYGYADPDDPGRARISRLPAFIQKVTAANPVLKTGEREELREQIDQHLTNLVIKKAVSNREDVLTALKDVGLTINRIGSDYLSVRLGDGKSIRLKGTLYEASFRADVKAAGEHEARARFFVNDAPKRAERSASKLRELTAARSEFHRKRYRKSTAKTASRVQESRGVPIEVGLGARHERVHPDRVGDRVVSDGQSNSGAIGVIPTARAAGKHRQFNPDIRGASIGAGRDRPLLHGPERATVRGSFYEKGEVNGRFRHKTDRQISEDIGAREGDGGGHISSITDFNEGIDGHSKVARGNLQKLADADRKLGKIFDAIAGAVKKAIDLLKRRIHANPAASTKRRDPFLK